MKSASFQPTILRWALVLLVTSSSTGCLSLLGIKPRSSLRPRMAALDTIETSTIRSQDELLPDRSAAVSDAEHDSRESGGGYSFGSISGQEVKPSSSAGNIIAANEDVAPTARLLRPEFNLNMARANGVHTNSPGSSGPPPRVVTQSVDRTAGAPGQPLGLTVDRLRELMNQQSANAMSDSEILSNHREEWNVINIQGADAPNLPLRQNPAVNTISQSEVPVTPAGSEAIVSEVVEELPDSATDAAPASEPSMIDRLRGIYGSSSEPASRSRWRLPSPWSVFRDKEEADAVSAAEDAAAPVQTAEAEALVINSPAVTSNPLLQDLISKTQQEIANWPRLGNGAYQERQELARRQQNLRLLYLIADDPGNAISAIDALPPREQEFWQDAMLGLAQFRSGDSNPEGHEQRITNTVGQFRSAIRKLIPSAALRIRRMDICSQIYSFGRVETFPSNTFTPGQPILLYVELENFASQATRDGSYRTSFDARLQFFADGDDEPIATKDLPEVTDEATSERTDYFQSFELNIPSHLDAGDYRIAVQLLDRNSGRRASGNVQFRIQGTETAGI